MLESLWVVYASVFACVTAIAWLTLDYVAASKVRPAIRLEEFGDPRKRAGKSTGSRRNELFAKWLDKASPSLAKPLKPKTEAEKLRLKSRLDHAGFRSERSVLIFLALKIASLIGGFVTAGGVVLFSGVTKDALLRTGFACGLLFYLPDFIVWCLSRRRQMAIFFDLPDALDLLAVCVEAGLGLDQAMRKVAEEMKRSHRIIAAEFALCNFQLQMGKSRREALQELGERNGVDDLRSLARVLIQAEKFGSSVSKALRVQSDAMRNRRRQLAEEKAAKTAVKLIFPLVLFIFPGIFVVLAGPAAITMVRDMFPMMSGTQ